MGTSSGSLDTSQGLASALGGAGAHPLTFAGDEIKPVVGANSVVLTEVWGAGMSPTAWVSHPSASGIGYRRPSPGVSNAALAGFSALGAARAAFGTCFAAGTPLLTPEGSKSIVLGGSAGLRVRGLGT